MLPQFYQTILTGQLSPKNFHFLQLVLGVLQQLRQVKLETLAHCLGMPIRAESRRKRLQRFLDLDCWGLEGLWHRLAQAWMAQHFPLGGTVYVIIDRTNWTGVNLLMVSVAWGKRAFPLHWILLDKSGSSNLAEQQQIFTPALEALKGYDVVVLGDREFCSVKLADWLATQPVKFCVRLKQNEAVEVSPDHWRTTLALALKPGTSRFYPDIKVTKTKGFGKHHLAIKWQRDYDGFHSDEPWILLTNLPDLETALKAYAKRFRIEELFRDLKRGGYCLESAKVRGQRLVNLVLFMAIAYTSAGLKGRQWNAQGIKPYVTRVVQEAHRRYPRHSHFHIGSSGLIWANAWQHLQDHLFALLRLNPNKRRFYLRGLKAMATVQKAF
jgi:Transposase DDE domain